MKLSEYFEQAKGIGVLATADAHGKVNVAIYARQRGRNEVPRLLPHRRGASADRCRVADQETKKPAIKVR